jgi:hypothetical protein
LFAALWSHWVACLDLWLPWRDYNSRTTAFQLARDCWLVYISLFFPLVRGWPFLQLASILLVCEHTCWHITCISCLVRFVAIWLTGYYIIARCLQPIPFLLLLLFIVFIYIWKNTKRNNLSTTSV